MENCRGQKTCVTTRIIGALMEWRRLFGTSVNLVWFDWYPVEDFFCAPLRRVKVLDMAKGARGIMPFLTFRRSYLDEKLAGTAFTGLVMDIGGKKVRRRGKFVPPLDCVKAWHVVNLDPSAAPDLCCDAAHIPVSDGSYDMALLCEVLEHLPSPGAVLAEACRILKPEGTLVLSAPFLYAAHPDPADYQRWTTDRISKALAAAGFKPGRITKMGGFGAVIYDMAVVLWCNTRWRRFLRLIRPVFALMERLNLGDPEKVTTGYFALAQKVSP